MEKSEAKLPKEILDKAIPMGNEFGFREKDFIEVIEVARKNKIAIIGGQIQYIFEDGTCELYWLSYDSESQKNQESWVEYCDRSANECRSKFQNIVTTTDFEKEIENFEFLKQKRDSGISIEDSKVFIIYFQYQE
ncbi:hypothetical protein [Flavobacterium longum]|uniref:hypothetical protein n=1 Tax=Flavobacterium longum TaxID=1299340 RepID=UPI0039E77541